MNFDLIRKHRTFFLLLIDTVCILLSYCFAFWIRMEFTFQIPASNLHAFFKFLPVMFVINLIFIRLFKVNNTLWKYISIHEVFVIVTSIVSANIVWFLTVVILKIDNYPRSLPVIACLLMIAMMLGVRFIYRYYRGIIKQHDKQFNALIIGAGDAGVVLSKELQSEKYKARVVGFIDDDIRKVNKTVAGIKVLGTSDMLPEIAKKYNVQYTYIGIVNASKKDIHTLLTKCQNASLQTKIMKYNADDTYQKTQIRDVSIDDLLGRGEIHLSNEAIRRFIKNQVVLVTGAGGSIGSELIRQIIQFEPSEVVLVDIYENNMYDLQQDLLRKQKRHLIPDDIKITCLIASVRDRKRIFEIMEHYHPFVVYHAAAHKHVPLVEASPLEAIKNNVIGTKNVLDACVASGVQNFVLISSDKAVNPTNVMGATKRICELIVQGYRDNPTCKVCAVRFGNVLGSNGSVIPLFKKQIEEGGPITVTHPDITRYFMTIPEASQLVLQASIYAHKGEIFVLDMGSPIKIVDIVEKLIRLSGLRPYEDIAIEFTGLRPGEKLFEELKLEKETHIKTENNLIYIAKPIIIDDLKQRIEAVEKLTEDNYTDIFKLIE